MTADELYQNALALIVTDKADSSDFTSYAGAVINLLLSETFATDNSLRLSKGLLPLDAPQHITDLSQELEVQEELAAAALPYGVCAKLLVEDDVSKAVYFQNLYALAVRDCDRCLCTPITDVYGDEC